MNFVLKYMMFLYHVTGSGPVSNHQARVRPRPRLLALDQRRMTVSRAERLSKLGAMQQRRTKMCSKRPRGLNLSKANRKKAAITRRANEVAIWNDLRQYRAERDTSIKRIALRHGKTEAFVRSLMDSNSKLSKSLRKINPYNAFIHCKSLQANDGEFQTVSLYFH
jgi:hypothetical protein